MEDVGPGQAQSCHTEARCACPGTRRGRASGLSGPLVSEASGSPAEVPSGPPPACSP